MRSGAVKDVFTVEFPDILGIASLGSFARKVRASQISNPAITSWL